MEENTTAYILAGGKSKRMGTDKGLLLLNEKPFISHICEALEPIVGENIVIVSSNSDYDFLGHSRIEDIISDKGPVGGIYSALKHSKTKFNIILSVDVPLVSTELLRWIIENHDESCLITQIQAGYKPSPLIAIYHRSVKSFFEEHLANNQLKLSRLIEEINHKTIVVPKKWNDQVQNVNTQEEYQKLIT